MPIPRIIRTSTFAAKGDPCGLSVERAQISNAEIEAQVPALRLQIVRAGVRLARLLDEAL